MASADRGHLSTEASHPATSTLETLDAREAVRVMLGVEAEVLPAVEAAAPELAAAVDLIATRLAAGGRWFTLGAGTSGRLAALDAAECPPTFSTPRDLVQAIVAGGRAALTAAVEGAEDDRAAAARAVDGRGVGAADVVLGISAGGTTPFVHAGLARAAQRGAATIFFACVPLEQAPDDADLSIRVVTGPEAVAGSTRLKAGTATKIVLNTLSTLVMTRLGKVHAGRMVDVDTRANQKLVDRAERLVMDLGQVERERARSLLEASAGRVKPAVLMARLDVDASEAEARLERAQGHLSRALAIRNQV